ADGLPEAVRLEGPHDRPDPREDQREDTDQGQKRRPQPQGPVVRHSKLLSSVHASLGRDAIVPVRFARVKGYGASTCERSWWSRSRSMAFRRAGVRSRLSHLAWQTERLLEAWRRSCP